MKPYQKIVSKKDSSVVLKVVSGHFITPNSHINSYIDMTTMKTRYREALSCAKALSCRYSETDVIDTIICMDNTEVIGAYLAQELENRGVKTKNTHNTVYICTPEYDSYGQMLFRDNSRMMLKNKNVLILLASTTTGGTLKRAIDAVHYHGGHAVEVSAIFSLMDKISDIRISALFTKEDLPEYTSNPADSCDMCKRGVPIDAICNGFGYTEVDRNI